MPSTYFEAGLARILTCSSRPRKAWFSTSILQGRPEDVLAVRFSGFWKKLPLAMLSLPSRHV